MTALPIATVVGVLNPDDDLFFRREGRFGRDQCGWLRARSAVLATDEPLVTGVDRRGRIRTVRLSEITRIKRKSSRR